MRPQVSLHRTLSKDPSFADVDDGDEVFADDDEREAREMLMEQQRLALGSLSSSVAPNGIDNDDARSDLSSELMVLRDRASSLPDISDIFGAEETGNYGPIPTYDDIREYDLAGKRPEFFKK